MRRTVIFGLICLLLILCVCGCNADEILDAELRPSSDFDKIINETTNQRGEIVFTHENKSGIKTDYHTGCYYDNSADADKLTAVSSDYYNANESRTDSGAKSLANEFMMSGSGDKENDSCLRNYNGRYYRIQKINRADSREAYGFTFWDETGWEICHYCFFKLYSMKECGIEKGKTTIDDIEPYFPFDNLERLHADEKSLTMELQFTEGEYQLEFIKKDGDYVLDNLDTPFFSLNVAQSILPKDLALITEQ